ncbi:MAG: transposase [Desulfovibrio sp.]|jgi:transposase|nr:transposase [Desulfovibrio sp.]
MKGQVSLKSRDGLLHLLQFCSTQTEIWDGAPIHRSKELKRFLSEESQGRIHLERLPPYSPDLNPNEGVWQYLKCVCLKNVSCQDIRNLKKELKGAISILRSRRHIITACFERMEYV